MTIADLTIQNIRFNGFKINCDRKAHRVTIYNCVVHNIWQRGVKGPATKEPDAEELSPRDCRVQYCLFYNDRPKQFSDDPTDTAGSFSGNYVGGIDAMQARGWTISDNVFWGIRGRTGEARGAVFLWMDARDCMVERNVIVNCDTGICLGNSHRSPLPDPLHGLHRAQQLRRSVRRRTASWPTTPRTARSCTTRSTVPTAACSGSSGWSTTMTACLVANNLLSGPPMRIETQSKVQMRGNVVQKDLAASFVDAAAGNLHLKAAVPGVSGAAELLPDVPEDFDRQRRGKQTDAGADQLAK